MSENSEGDRMPPRKGIVIELVPSRWRSHSHPLAGPPISTPRCGKEEWRRGSTVKQG